jgi:hypothetical protein
MSDPRKEIEQGIDQAQQAMKDSLQSIMTATLTLSGKVGAFLQQLQDYSAKTSSESSAQLEQLKTVARNLDKLSQQANNLNEGLKNNQTLAALEGVAALPPEQAKKTSERIEDQAKQLHLINKSVNDMVKTAAKLPMLGESVPAGLNPSDLKMMVNSLEKDTRQLNEEMKNVQQLFKDEQLAKQKAPLMGRTAVNQPQAPTTEGPAGPKIK